MRHRLSELEKPLTAKDYVAQETVLKGMIEALRGSRVPNLEAIDLGMRGRLLTGLLRVGRQEAKDPDEAKEKARQNVFALLAQIWKALNDERRMALALAHAGGSASAVSMLEQAGEWEKAAKMHEEGGRFVQAAKLYESKQAFADAARAYKAANDAKGWLRSLLKAGAMDELKAAAREVPAEIAIPMLLRNKLEAEAIALLAEKKDFAQIASIHERAKAFALAAKAWEEGGDLFKAAADYQKADDTENVERCAQAIVAPLLSSGNKVEAGEALARLGRYAQAVELAGAERPDKAHQWLMAAKNEQAALELSQRMAKKTLELGHWDVAAQWLERSGEIGPAAETYLKAGRPHAALPLFEQSGAWDAAAKCAEAAGKLAHALELFERVHDAQGAERIKEAIAKREAEKAARKAAEKARGEQTAEAQAPQGEVAPQTEAAGEKESPPAGEGA